MTKANKNTGFLTALFSIMAAAIGIQKRENMERDLNAANPSTYIIAALVFLLLFVGSILLIVSLVVPSK